MSEVFLNMKVNMLLITIFLPFIQGIKENKPIPDISNNFVCNTLETDANGTTVLEQSLVWDSTNRRSLMHASGALVRGGMEQIKRCDLFPNAGWFTNAGGPDPSNLSNWSCTNTTIPPSGEFPWHCVYNDFWEIDSIETPEYMGVEAVQNVSCDRWNYQMTDPNTGDIEKYAFWAIQNESKPCASSRLGIYTLYFSNFTPGHPPLTAFEPNHGYTCPNSSLLSEIDPQNLAHHTIMVQSGAI